MIEVDSGALGAAGVARAGLGSDLESVCRSLRIAVDLLDAACADPQLSCAAAQFARAWVTAIAASAAGQADTGRGLTAAGDGYMRVESAATKGLAS